ncbi:hypothetical protein HJC23_000131 [Cyclotella cryptica]|uniref:PDZ domain-containing protein n=1 Tax=Cyclotella cryptica TaxID=29204 RepID=A0ABD3NJY1_9STRA|eukprot:CCRYP_020738-RA/>CCRYP_020738-RA protein AED:0.27 eAED:0.27 QI:0/-1/0/1/-1/1/1/0/569
MEPPPISDEQFDALWNKAVADAARQNPRPSMTPKDPSERRKPRSGIYPISSLVARPKPRPQLTSSGSGRRLSTGDEKMLSLIHRKGGRRNNSMALARSLPLAQAMMVSPTRGDSVEDRQSVMPHRNTSIPQADNGSSQRAGGLHRRSTVSSEGSIILSEEQDRALTSSSRAHMRRISFSNLPELGELMRKPTVGTTGSDYSSSKYHTSKTCSVETHEQERDGKDDVEPNSAVNGFDAMKVRKSSKKKKVTTKDIHREVADYILNNRQQSPLFSLPTILSISSFKEHKDQLSGLVISRDAGCEVLVRKISPTSIFAETRLRQGQEILTINNRRVKCPLRATTIVKSIKGEVNFLVSEGKKPPGTKYVKAKIEKYDRLDSGVDSVSLKSADAQNNGLGITLESYGQGLVRVARIDADGVFGSTPLREDDIVVAVNGECAQNLQIVMELLRQFYEKGGVAILLVYSMIDLRLGLVDRIIKSPWEILWDANFRGAAISRKPALEEQHSVSFNLLFREDWSCELLPCDSDYALASDTTEIHLAIKELNDAIALVVGSWSAAIKECKQDGFAAEC